jgi:hypothetical protein
MPWGCGLELIVYSFGYSNDCPVSINCGQCLEKLRLVPQVYEMFYRIIRQDTCMYFYNLQITEFLTGECHFQAYNSLFCEVVCQLSCNNIDLPEIADVSIVSTRRLPLKCVETLQYIWPVYIYVLLRSNFYTIEACLPPSWKSGNKFIFAAC